MRYAYECLRSGAAWRGKAFHLTRQEYEEFCLKTDYYKLKGKPSLSLSIDRVDNNGPYAKWNVAAITLRENSRKDRVPCLRQYAEQFGVKL